MDEALTREEELFDAARQVGDPGQRLAYLARACDGDDALRQRVERLLASATEAGDIFDECLAAVRLSAREAGLYPNPAGGSVREEQPGDFIGPWRILAKIGEGGCGVVYLTEQEQPVRRRVAVKVIKLGMDTRAVVARFSAERQALAMMDHPNIAKVFDAGSTSSGRPFFAMEYVSGCKITEFCDKAKLDVSGRLELFAQLCHAIQHAHQKGVVHRDIKPSNILVAWQDGRPMPKVIDFGIAKATQERLTDQTIFTFQSQLIGTPAYMSPEQADPACPDIDTRSDIYSLGALLYELLTGRPPFDPKRFLQSGFDELRRALREQDPTPPSALLASLPPGERAAAARQRQIEPARLPAMIRGDLDCIVLKALEKDRARRYQTANGLAMDVQRFLASEPILARPPSRLYQFERLVRRNKAVFAAVGAVALILVVALAASTWLWRNEVRARRRAVLAEQRAERLRQEAEARAQITHAAILLNNDQWPAADALIDSLDAAGPPAPEGAAVYRELGEWHALAGRWNQAVRRFASLAQVDQNEGWDRATLDFLELGVSLAEAGDAPGRRRFQDLCLERYSDTTNLVIAERLLKINLLFTLDPSLARALAPWGRIAAGPESDPSRAAWRSVSVALWEYRLGDYHAALEWIQPALSAVDNPCRLATARIIDAMALQRIGRERDAKRALTQGSAEIDRVMAAGLKPGDPNRGFWFDWVFARIIMNEAAGRKT